MIEDNKFSTDSSSEISVREIQQAELAQFKKMLLNFYAEIGHDFSEEDLDAIVDYFLKKGSIVIAVDNSSDEIVGLISFIESNALYARGDFGVINELYIVPEFRSKKIGQKLIDFLIAIGKSKNWTRLELDTPEIEKSEKTINFYKKEGIVPIGYRMKKNLI